MDQKLKQEVVLLVTHGAHRAGCKDTSAARPRSTPMTRADWLRGDWPLPRGREWLGWRRCNGDEVWWRPRWRLQPGGRTTGVYGSEEHAFSSGLAHLWSDNLLIF